MKVKELCLIAIMASLEVVVFTSFSFVLYLECITLTIVLFAMVFPRRMACMSSFLFGRLNMILVQGITPWSIGYFLIYPVYSYGIASNRTYLSKHFLVLCGVCAFCSFLTGQLLQLPFLFFSKYVTFFYIIMGLKTSLIQGIVSFISCMILYKPIEKVLLMIKEKML